MYIHTYTRTSTCLQTLHVHNEYTRSAEPSPQGDLGNKNDSVTDKEITADNI